uniref:Uncharacterized protein n=1 Tax=mine drainage metagenome TaxID=410659 RepID=E6QT76_9ZZZZ
MQIFGRCQEPAGLKGNRLQIRLAGAYFTAFLVNRTTIDRQNRQNMPSPSRILRAAALWLACLNHFASIFQVRQTPGRTTTTLWGYPGMGDMTRIIRVVSAGWKIVLFDDWSQTMTASLC